MLPRLVLRVEQTFFFFFPFLSWNSIGLLLWLQSTFKWLPTSTFPQSTFIVRISVKLIPVAMRAVNGKGGGLLLGTDSERVCVSCVLLVAQPSTLVVPGMR